MADSKKSNGFSFQLSETPPPAQSLTPLGELDLDFNSFSGSEDSTERVAAEAHAKIQDFGKNTATASTASPTQRVENPTSFEILDAPDAARLLNDRAQTESKAASDILNEARPVERPSPSPTPEKSQNISAPRIKKIHFPEAARPTTEDFSPADSPAKKTGRAAQSLKQKTRFSESISAPAVAVQLTDSEPPPSIDALPDDLGVPEDLPEHEGGSNRPEPTQWGTETPTAREIWRNARKAWQATATHAVSLGGQGIRAGRHLASDMNVRMKARLEATANEKAARKQQETSEQDDPTRDGSSAAGRTLVNIGKASVRKLAAPLSAIAAAGAVYIGGTHLLGVDGGVALSKAARGPEIPELGALDNSKDGPVSKTEEHRTTSVTAEKEAEESSQQAGPSPVQVEVTKMPDGLSWPGKGLIEVVTSEEELIYVDEVFTGRGPLRRIPVSPGDHEVSIRSGGKERRGSVTVAVNKNTRAVFKSD